MNALVDRAPMTDAHFAFGENWKSFTQLLDETRIRQAELGLKRLFPADELSGARFLDIGCGSGLSSLAAARLGAAQIDAIDIDPESVAATRATLDRFARNGHWTANAGSVFDLSARNSDGYDIVYS